MKLNHSLTLLATALAALTMGTAAHANDNRSFAMGGAGVANGNYYQAASLNPALAAAYEDRDNFGLILPSLYVEVADQDEVFDAVDDFQDTYDQLERLLRMAEQGQPVSEEELEQVRQRLAENFADISGALVGRLGGQVALSIPNRFAAAQFFFNAELEAFGATRLDGDDVERILNAESTAELESLTSEGYVVGRLVTDLGVALARTFHINGREVRFGISPKLQELESFTYFSAIADIDEDDFDAAEFRSSSSQLNLDVGMSMPITQRWSAGLTVRNLLRHEVSGEPIFSRQVEDFVTLGYELRPHAAAGLGYSTQRMTLSLDADLTSQNYLGLTDESQRQVFGYVRQTQFVRAGYEYNVARWVQLRLGYRHDLEGTYDDAITAGLGLSPFGRVHINVSGMYVDDRSFGAGAQLMFTF